MDFIKNWIFSVCTTLILSVIFSAFIPKGNVGKFYKIIISLFIFVSFIYPLTDYEFKNLNVEFPAFSNVYVSELNDSNKKNIELLIKTKLQEQNINANVSVECSANSEETEIEKISIYVPDGSNAEEIKDFVYKELGLVADVKCLGE